MRILKHLTVNDEHVEAFEFQRELSMEAYLIENEDILTLDSNTYCDVEIIQPELTLKQGRQSKDTDGRIDILVTYAQEHIGIIELKIGELNEIHLEQLEDYLREKDQIRHQFPTIIDTENNDETKWIGVIVGNSINPKLVEKLSQNGYKTQSGIPIAALTIQRFRGKNGTIYVTTDNYFKLAQSNKDTTKYKFNGLSFGKGRLVLEVMKEYIGKHPGFRYSELEKIFPKILQGNRGVFATAEHANQVYSEQKSKRYFIKPDELIELEDSTIAISSQWSVNNIDNFISVATELGFKIT
jgi:hypothetical protein